MFRFTIRDVLWLTVVVAMGVGWWKPDLNINLLPSSSSARRPWWFCSGRFCR
jgi:hypothetical protein